MILVTGATGTVGSEVVKQLLAAGQKVRALARNPAKAKEKLGGQVEVVQGDMDDAASVAKALTGVEKVFLLSTGPVVVAHDATVIAAAKQAGVKHVVKLSAFGAEYEPGIELGRWHRKGEKALIASGMKWTILRPGGFSSNHLMSRDSIKAQGAFYSPTGDGKSAQIDPRDIARVAVVALTQPGHEGKEYNLTGSEALSGAEQAAILGKAIGKEVKHVDVPAAAAREGMLKSGMPAILVDGLLEFYGLIRAGHGAMVTPTVKDVTGKDPIPFAQWAKDHAELFK